MKYLILLGIFIVKSAFGTVGLSSHPFTMKKQVITTEFNNYLNNGEGAGLTAKYFQRMNEQINVDAGFSISDGERSSRVFAGADFQMIPDYGRQPRISVKGLMESVRFQDERINSFGAAPTISKGLLIAGKEAFPFIALPMAVNLNTETNEYFTSTAVAMGITGKLPFDGYDEIVANFETNMSVRNSFSSVVFGLSLPFR